MCWRQIGGAFKSERKAYKGWVFGAETTRWLWIFWWIIAVTNSLLLSYQLLPVHSILSGRTCTLVPMIHAGRFKNPLWWNARDPSTITEMIAEQFGRNSDAVTTWGCDFSVSPQFLLSEKDWRGGGGGQRGAEVEVRSRKEERKKKRVKHKHVTRSQRSGVMIESLCCKVALTLWPPPAFFFQDNGASSFDATLRPPRTADHSIYLGVKSAVWGQDIAFLLTLFLPHSSESFYPLLYSPPPSPSPPPLYRGGE